jgi:hypothetical protein
MNVADDSSCIRAPVARQMSHMPRVKAKVRDVMAGALLFCELPLVEILTEKQNNRVNL